MLDNSSPLPVKASGGIRTIEDFKTMVDLGVHALEYHSISILHGKQPMQILEFLKKKNHII